MPLRLFANCALVYVAVTAAMGRQVLASLGTMVASDPFDPMLNASILAWNALTVPWSSAWYEFPIFYPSADALTFSEHELGLSVIATPLYWITGNGLVSYNLTLLLTYPLCAIGMCALVWRLTRNGPAAFLAGLAFGFAPYRAAQLPHLQVLAVFWAPLALLGLHGYVDTGRRRWLALFAVCWLLQGAANGYFLVYFSVVVGLWVLWFAIAQGRWRATLMIAGAVAAAALPLLPIVYRYRTAHARYGFIRGIDEVNRFGADITAPLCPATGLTIWGWLGGNCGPEAELFMGPTLAVLCGIGMWAAMRAERATWAGRCDRVFTYLGRGLIVAAIPFLAGGAAVALDGPWRLSLGPVQITGSTVVKPFSTGVLLLLAGICASRSFRVLVQRYRAAAFYLVAAMATWALSWGPLPRLGTAPVLDEGPFAWLRVLPGVDALRVPARFWMMTVLCLCVLMGVLLAPWLRRQSRRVLLPVMIAATIGLITDGWMPIPAAALPLPPPNPDILRGGVALTLPIGPYDSTAEFRAVVGGWASVNGASGYERPYYQTLRDSLAARDSIVFEPFRSRSDLHVIVDERETELLDLVARQPGAEETARGNGQRQYRLPRQGRLALGAPFGGRLAVQSVSASCGDDRVALAIDGDMVSRWDCGAQTSDREFTADMGSVVSVGAVTAGLGTDLTNFPRRLVVETSVDGNGWDEAWTGSGLAAAFEADLHHPPIPPVTVSFPARQARYIRLRQIGRDEKWYWSIAELQVWAGP